MEPTTNNLVHLPDGHQFADDFMPFGGCTPMTMPDRLVSAGKKDEEYHRQMYRALIGSADRDVINDLRAHGSVNTRFCVGDQWFMTQELSTFLQDSSQKPNGRIPVKINAIRMAQEKYRSGASKTTYAAEAKPISPMWMTRREQSKNRYLQLYRDAQSSPMMKQAIGSMVPLGKTPEESASIHKNAYQDAVVAGVNGIMKWSAAVNNLNSPILHEEEAAQLFRFGITGTHFKVHQQFIDCSEPFDPYTFLWDTNARKRDLSDANWMGCSSLRNPTQIYERYDLSKEKRARIEEAARHNFMPIDRTGGAHSNVNFSSTAIAQVFCLYWRDVEYCEYGYVMGENDVPELVKVNYIGPDDDPNSKPKYTEKDLIDPPNRPSVQRAFNGKKTRTKTTEVLRYIDIIPWEYLLGGDNTQADKVHEKDQADIVLDYGVCELQEYDALETSSIKFPIKVITWDMDSRGRIVAPCTDLISPQRLFNRSLSIMEHQLGMSGGRSLVIDRDLLDITETKNIPKLLTKFSRGETILANSKGRGAPQVAHVVDSGLGSGAQALTGIMQQMLSMIRLVSATPEAITGTPTQDQLVGVTERLAQQANILDEPFYASLAWLYQQKYQFLATAGKDFYIRHPDVLYDMIGEEFIDAFNLSYSSSLEQHRVFIQRAQTDEVQMKQADQMLIGMRQMQLIDDERMMDLMGRSTMEEVYKAGRDFQQAKALAMREAAKEQQQQAMMQNIAMADAALREKEDAVYQNQVDAAMQRANNADKSRLAYEREDARAKGTWITKPEPTPVATSGN
jgi:hypothetical protein